MRTSKWTAGAAEKQKNLLLECVAAFLAVSVLKALMLCRGCSQDLCLLLVCSAPYLVYVTRATSLKQSGNARTGAVSITAGRHGIETETFYISLRGRGSDRVLTRPLRTPKRMSVLRLRS